MVNDLILNLPESVKLSKLLIDPEFANYNELLQRVVVLVLLHKSDELLGTTGLDLSDLSGKATTGALSAVQRALASAESNITKLINEEVPVTDSDNRIGVLTLSLEEVDRRFKLVVNIETEAKTKLIGAAMIDG